MAANVGMSPVMGESFSHEEAQQNDLRSLSAAIMAAAEKAELVAHETDRWLSGHQEFDNLDLVYSLVSEAEGRLVQMRQMTVIQELERFMDEITVNAPAEQATQLNSLMASTKETFSSAIDSLERFVQRAENIQKAFTKYKDSAQTLGEALTETSQTLQVISHHGDFEEICDQVEAVKASRSMLGRMKTCLRNMKDAMAGIESLTLTVCDLGMEQYVTEYKQRRAELSEALTQLETVQSEMEMFVSLHDKCESNIAELNGVFREGVVDSKEMDHYREQAEQVQLMIHDMERLVESLQSHTADEHQQTQLFTVKEDYTKLVTKLNAAYSSSYQSSISGSPPGGSAKSSPRRSPRRQTPSDPGTPRHSLRKWLRSKTDELQELMTQPFPFDDKNIQVFWHSIQKYQGDLVVRGEEFSVYVNEAEGDQSAMDQITPLIDTCADLSYRLDTHARLCVQYTADQNGLVAELTSLEEAKDSLQHSEIPLREQHRMCTDLLAQVGSLKRRMHEQLTNKLPPITINLAKKEGGAILTDTSELDAAVSKLKLELKAFHQSLEASISNLDLLTKQLKDLHTASSQLDQSDGTFTFTQPITRDNVAEALNSCKRQLTNLADRQQRIDKLLSQKGVAIGRLPSRDDEQFAQTLAQSTSRAEQAVHRLEQHHSNLASLQQTVERFDARCDEAKDSLHSAERLLGEATDPPQHPEVTETVETITTQCKTRLHECVTYIEQAEIAVTEMEQKNNGASKMDSQKEIIKEIQVKHKTLSAKLRDLETKAAMTAENQRSLDSLCRRFDDWLSSAQTTIGDQISLTSGMNDMRDHIIQLHELEKSVEGAQGWLMEMKKLCRSLAQGLPSPTHSKLVELVAGKESDFEDLKETLTERIQVLSKEMEGVIAWIQKSAELVQRLNDVKHQLTDLSNKEMDGESIQWKLDTLEGHITATEGMEEEFSLLVVSVPQAVTDKQRKSAFNGQEACNTMLADLTAMYNTLSRVDKVWTEFKHLASEVKGHLRHCEGQLKAVDLPGVSLDAKCERYQEIGEALERYPEGTSPPYLQELLSTCSLAAPVLYSEAILLMDEHETILANARKGADRFSQQLRSRSSLEDDLKSVTCRLKDMGDQLQGSLLLEDWSVRSCDALMRALQTEETELKALTERITPQILSQREQHTESEETMTLDLKEAIEEFEEMQRELIAVIIQEKEVQVLAKEFCQYISESVGIVDAWLSQTELLSAEVTSGNLSPDSLEHTLQSALDDVAGIRQHMARVSKYAEQISGSLTESAQTRLNDLSKNLVNTTNTREGDLMQLLEHHEHVGQTKVKFSTMYSEAEELIETLAGKLGAVSNKQTASLEECEDKLLSIEAIEQDQAAVQFSVEGLFEVSDTLSQLLEGPRQHGDDHEQHVKKLCAGKWAIVKEKLAQIKNDAVTSQQLFADIATQHDDIIGEEYEQLQADVKELETADLHSLSLPELERLEHQACQCNATISKLWQKFLVAQEKESSLLSKVGGGRKTSGRSADIGSQLTSLTSRCQAMESGIEKASVESRSIRDSLAQRLEQLMAVEASIKQSDAAGSAQDIQGEQEQLQQAKSEVSALYQSCNEVISTLNHPPPPDVTNIMNSVQNLNEALLEDIQQRLGQADKVMEQWNVVHVMQQDLEKWLANTTQVLSGDIVDSQIALSQQKELEEHMGEYCSKLSSFASKSHDLEKALSSPEGQRLLETVSHFQNGIAGIKQGLDKRRAHVSDLVRAEENFQSDLQDVTAVMSAMDGMTRQEVADVTPEKCEQLANKYQEELRRMPQVEQKLNDLVTLSIRLGDSSHHADSTTKVIDLKKEWSGLKTRLSQQASALKETTRLLLAAPQLAVSHQDWATTQELVRTEVEDNLRELHQKIDGSELMQTDQILAQLKVYETEGSKLKGITEKIEEIVGRKRQLQEASLDPMMLKDWAGQMTRMDSELKQLYMKADETQKRQSGIADKAHKMAEEGAKREQMEDPVVPVPAQVLDLSMESDQCVEEMIVKSVASQPHASLSQDEHAARLFTVERHPETSQTEERMNKMISEHEDLQTTLADVNKQIGQWQWALDQGYHSAEELKHTLGSMQQTKSKLDKLSKSEAASQEPSLPVLSMSMETLELRCLSEIQRLETNDSLTQDHKQTLDSIEEEVVSCQKYLDHLSNVPGEAEEKLPGVEHRVSKLQRMFQTLKLINPALCDGSLVSEYLGQLMNDLQVLQGRLEVIPEEGDFHSHGRDLHSWQEYMADHVARHEANSDTEFVDRVVSDLSSSLRSLTSKDKMAAQPSKHAMDSLSAYKEMLSAAEKGLHSSRLIDSEHASEQRENLQDLFTLFESYRLHLGSLALTSEDGELGSMLSQLSAATRSLQKDLWSEAERCRRMKEVTNLLHGHCDTTASSLAKLQSDYYANNINQTRLERSMGLAEAEYNGLLSAVESHLSKYVRSPELREKVSNLRALWESLEDCLRTPSAGSTTDGMAQIFSELIIIQQSSKRKLDLSAPMNLCLGQALDMLVELDSLNWIYKELYADKADDVDLDIKSSILSIRPKMNAIRSDLQAKLRECSGTSTDSVQKIYKWLGEVKPFTKQLASLSAIHDHLHELLTYQCDLSQRSYITGLMMSLVTSCDHDIIVTSQNTVKVLHEAKLAAGKQLTTAHSMQKSYKAFDSAKRSFESWVKGVQSLMRDCPIGSDHAVAWLAHRCQVLRCVGEKLTAERHEFVRKAECLSSQQLCSQAAVREVSRQVKDLLDKQESCMSSLGTLRETVNSVTSDWTEFTRVYEESCTVLDAKEYLMEAVPSLSAAESVQEFQAHLDGFKLMLADTSRQIDKIQPIAHRLRLTITVQDTLQALSVQVQSVKSREYKLYSQRFPLMIERWQKAQVNMAKYEHGAKDIKLLIQDASRKLETRKLPAALREVEMSVTEYQRLLHRLDSVDWSEIERHSAGVGQLTGLVLCQVPYLRRTVDYLRTELVGLLTESTEACATISHSTQTIHSLENKLSRMERDPLLTSSHSRLSYKTLLDRRSKTEQLLFALLAERQTLDNLISQISSPTVTYTEQLGESVTVLDSRYSHVLELINSRLGKLQEEIIAHADSHELQAAYQDWKNQVIKVTSEQLVGEVKDLEEQRLKCLLHINLSAGEKMSLRVISSRSSFSHADHDDLVETLRSREAELASLVLKHRLFHRLRGMVMYSLRQLDSQLDLPDRSYHSHAVLSDRVPKLKAGFEQHQRSALVMRQICQELLPHCDAGSRSTLLTAVQKASSKWQAVLSKFINQSDESMTVMSNAVALNHSMYSYAKELASVRQGACGTLPEHHDHLQERQSYADVFEWRLDKLSSKSSVMKFDLSTLESQADSLTDIEICFNIGQTLTKESQSMLTGLKQELGDSLAVWSNFVSEVNVTLQQIQSLERLYMNEKRLTIEELLEEITSIYSLELAKLSKKSDELIARGTVMLPTTGDLYGSAIQHGIVSLQTSMKHLTRLSTTRTNKLRDTMSAILEFESGMKSLNQWFRSTESALVFIPADWQDSTILSSHQYLLQLEKDVSHHSRTVTAVINLCSLLQYDRDAGYDQRVKQELAAVKERLNNRWKKLCEKIIARKELLYELGQAWAQMKAQTEALIAELSRYKEKCEDHRRTRMLSRPKAHQLAEFSKMLKDCESRHEDMRLLNNRHRYLVRQNMLDTSGVIKRAVSRCTELWDTVYQSLSSIVKEMKSSHETWSDFVKERDVLLTKVSNLSLILKTKPGSRDLVEKKLAKYQTEADTLFALPVANVRSTCTSEEHRKLDHMIQELTVNLDTLRSELRPLDNLEIVEEELDMFVQQTEDIENAFRKTSPLTSAPFQKYMSATRRSLSRDRAESQELSRTNSPKRTRSVSLERGATADRVSRGRTLSDRPHTSHTRFTPSQARLSPQPAFSAETDYLPSVAPMSAKSPLPDTDLPAEQQDGGRRQLKQDMTRTLEWIEKVEVLSTSIWRSNLPSNCNLYVLIQACKQYNDILAEYHHFRSLAISINLATDLDASAIDKREKLNSCWKEVGKYLSARQQQLQSAVMMCQGLRKEVDEFCDSVTHAELKVLSGTHTKQSVVGEVRQTLVCVRSYITLLTSLLCESEGKGKDLLDNLRACETKCQSVLS